MLEQPQFTIQGITFRPKQLRPTELLGLEEIINTSKIEKATYMFDCICERIEVKISDTWVDLKEKNKDIYTPADVVDKPGLLYKICTTYLVKYLMPLFQLSEESKK